MEERNYRDTVFKFFILGFLVWFGLAPAAQAQTVGYEIPAGVVNYSNSGSVSAEETVGDDESLSDVTGVYSDHGLNLFENTAAGSISALGQVGDAVTNAYAQYTYGAFFEGKVFEFINAGTVTATAVAGDALNSFGTSAVEYVVGARFDDDAGSFTNTGTISASGLVGDALGDYSRAYVQGAKGVYFYYDVGDFTNEGTISASAVVGDAVGYYSNAYIFGTRGVHVYDGYVYGDFVNAGEISASAVVGDAVGDSSDAYIHGTRAIHLDEEVYGDFTNDGTISASAVVGSAVGDSSDAYIYGTRAIHLDEEVYGDFTNDGTISASTVVGSALGFSADVWINGTHGIHFDDDLYGNFINEGTISAGALVGDAAGDSSYASISGTRGIHFDDYVYGSFTNKGTISGSSVVGDAAGADSYAYIYDAQGVRFDYDILGGFANEGTISGSAVVGNAAGDSSSVYVDGTRGIFFEDEIYGGFTNDGTISATAVAGDAAGASSYATIEGTRGIHFDDDVYGFTNNGTITSSDTVGSATGESSDVYIEGSRGVQFDDYLYGGFINDGTISAATVVGDAAGDLSEAYIEGTRGVLLDSYVYGKFTNTGEISASATAGSAIGDSSEIYVVGTRGVQFDYGLEGSFTNTGTIDASAAVGDAAGDSSEVYVRGLHGVVFGSRNNYNYYYGSPATLYGNFSNEGTITATASLGDASGNDSYAWAHHIFGVRLFDEIYGTFTNTGTISTSLTAGSASGENSAMEITDIYGVYLAAGAGSFDNQGDISVDVQAGDNAMIEHVAGVFVNNGGGFNNVPMSFEPTIMVTEPLPSDAGTINNSGSISASVKAGAGSFLEADGIVVIGDARINNTGDIFVSVDSPYEDSVARAAGIYLDGSTAEVSNSGAVYLFSNMGGDSDMRTLAAYDSNVTFVDSFSAVFGSPGIEDDPVYIDELSTLNINDADLIARAGTGLLLATPYGVIENDGAVEGEFANLTAGYTNPDITVNWADSAEKGENAAVVFGFEPKNNVGARSVNVGSALLSQRLNLFSNVLYGPGSSSELTADVNRKKILYAQADQGEADTYPASVPRAYRYENGMYFLPYYSKLSDSGIGADADTYGFFLGYERILGDDFIVGAFGGHSRSDLDYTGVFNGNTEDQDTYSLGINVVYDQPRWFGDFFANYNWISHEYAGRTGANFELPETADYDSTAFVSQIRTGYKHPLGYDAGLYPYVGLRSTYWSTDGYTTSVAPANWRKNYGSFSETWFKGILGLSADKKWQGTDASAWRLYGGVGVERTLNDNDVVITQTLQGISASVKEEYSRTSWTGNVGVEYGKNNISVTFDVSGEKNSDYDAYGGLFKFKYKF